MLALRLIAASVLRLVCGTTTTVAAEQPLARDQGNNQAAATRSARSDPSVSAEASIPLATADTRTDHARGDAATAPAAARELEEDVDAEAEKARTRDCPLSHAINLGVTRALLRPPTNNPPDSCTYTAGIRCQQRGFLKQDTMLQSSIPALQDLANKGLRFEFAFNPGLTWSSFGAPSFTAMVITSVDLYTGKTGFLWPNGQFHATGSGWINNACSSPAINAFAAENPPPLNNYRLFELWYEHKLTPKFTVRLDTIHPWVTFASHQTSAIFQNLAFDFPGLYGTTTTGNVLPYAAPPPRHSAGLEPEPPSPGAISHHGWQG